MKQTFTPKSFSDSHQRVIDAANAIIEKYEDEGYDLTLRQLYYQFVAQDLFPDEWLVQIAPGQMTKNHERNYKKLGGIINDARLAGAVDWGAIVDRTRQLTEWQHERGIASALQRMKSNYTLDMWETQPTRVEVWVEKEALAGVVSRVCGQYDVPYFSCRGYTSASSSYEAYKRVASNIYRDQKTLILHFGDHDPSGLDMTRDITDRLATMISSEEGSDFDDCFEVRRLALNFEQVRVFNPPPSPAKITDSRSGAYIDQFGEDSWELDALPPNELADLIEDELTKVIDRDEWATRQSKIEADKSRIQTFLETLDV